MQRRAQRVGQNVRATVNETANNFQTKGVSGVAREAFADTTEAMKDLSNSAGRSMQHGVNWIVGDEPEDHLRPPPARSSSASSSAPVWRPPRMEMPPRLEDLQKGTKVLRRLAPAIVVKVDYEADPPALVVRMVDGGNEVGTDAANISLSPEASQRCLTPGVHVLIVDLKGKTELNGCGGALIEYKADVARWNVKLHSRSEAEVVSVKPQNLSVLLRSSKEAGGLQQTSLADFLGSAPSSSASSTREGPAGARLQQEARADQPLEAKPSPTAGSAHPAATISSPSRLPPGQWPSDGTCPSASGTSGAAAGAAAAAAARAVVEQAAAARGREEPSSAVPAAQPRVPDSASAAAD